MDKVSIKLQGGLGNYMFQIAAAYAYAKKNNKECLFTTDDSVVIHKHLNNYKNNILQKINFVNNCNFQTYSQYQEKGFSFSEIENITGNVYLLGYFQSEKYFKDYKEEIKNLFTFSPQLKFEILQKVTEKYRINFNEEICSIHVRRGDYLKVSDCHPQQGMNYYMKAIKKIGMDKKFLIFSDDIAWCKENFPKMDNFIFIEGMQDYEDLLIMSECKHNIICNSTFSWWAAWLNNNEQKNIIAPNKWFGESYSHFDTKDIYCEGWLRM